jgi:hypothetical protein
MNKQFATTLKKTALFFLSLSFASSLQAQSKIIKEVGEDISTQMKPILQDNSLVGYLAFTRLEKADADSFNYRVTIMDENLIDIGTVNFRQRILDLQTVSFEQNVLCLGYIQTKLDPVEKVRTENGYRKIQDAANSSHLVLQFINLNGRIVNDWTRDVNLNFTGIGTSSFLSSSIRLISHLKYGMQIRNIPNGGFALFYGDEIKQSILTFDLKGNLEQEQVVPALGHHFILRTSASNVYLLAKQNKGTPEGGYRLYVYSAKGLRAENDFELRDGYDNPLKVLSFENDPATGDPFIAGCIINPRRERLFGTAYDYCFAPYLGLFTLELGNPHKEMHANCSYWSTQHFPGIEEDGMFTDKYFYVHYGLAFRDYQGNTIFAGTALEWKGNIGASKCRLTDAVFVRQEASGTVALDNNIACDDPKSIPSAGFLPELDKKDYYKVTDPDTKMNYMIIDDDAKIYIYNVNSKKVVRIIPHKEGNEKINVYPAKEGHMLVAEYNRKEKYTRFSIEAL